MINTEPKHRTVRTFDELTTEMRAVPILRDSVSIQPKNKLEEFFINSAEKHGVFDRDEIDEHEDEDMYY
jgi:hypothetical protein